MNHIYRELPDKLFTVKIPVLATYSEAEIDILGIRTDTVNGSNDPKSHEYTTIVMLPVKRLVEIYSQGFPISVINESDMLEIYDILERYLKDWDGYEYTSPNLINMDSDDDFLELINTFLTEVFGNNKSTIVKDTVDHSAGNSGFLPEINTMNTYGLLTNPGTELVYDDVDDTGNDVMGGYDVSGGGVVNINNICIFIYLFLC